MKKKANKLIIIKYKKLVDDYGLLLYSFRWYNDFELVLTESQKMDRDKNGDAIERYNIDDMIKMKNDCCLEIDINDFSVETINVE